MLVLLFKSLCDAHCRKWVRNVSKKRQKSLLLGFTFGGRGSHKTVGVTVRLSHNEWLPLGGRNGLAARVSSWCLSVFHAKRQCFAYSAEHTDVCHFTRDHLEIMRKWLGDWEKTEFCWERKGSRHSRTSVQGDYRRDFPLKGLDWSILRTWWKGESIW